MQHILPVMWGKSAVYKSLGSDKNNTQRIAKKLLVTFKVFIILKMTKCQNSWM